ncbi:hypothetical protein OG911_28125 [Streptomyces sp. NBC_00208]|uniref:hypothetical protein n=1 Tax=Streptomyces sp. NBC_00208 TaxID=2975681 RepID=UPI002E2C2605|nr:hypothetical protein [Streptomyces sp. NBC_00208]
MTNFAAQLNALLAQIADAAECDFWECHQLPEGQHYEPCLTGCDTAAEQQGRAA